VIQVRSESPYAHWSAADWVRHYAGPRYVHDRHDVGATLDRLGRRTPRSLSAREFPLGFLNPSVPPICTPPLPAVMTGTASLLNPGLYGPGGTLVGKALTFTINGGAPVIVHFVVAPPDVATVLADINAIIAPAAMATDVDNVLVITTTATGSGASLLVTGTGVPILGLPVLLVTGTDLTPGQGSVAIVSQSQLRAFRGERLVIPAEISDSFALLDIKIGNRSQFANSMSMPASTFIEGAVGVRLQLDTAEVAQDIALIVQNLTSAPLAFRATMIGSTFV
jgi:hypothetical protein